MATDISPSIRSLVIEVGMVVVLLSLYLLLPTRMFHQGVFYFLLVALVVVSAMTVLALRARYRQRKRNQLLNQTESTAAPPA